MYILLVADTFSQRANILKEVQIMRGIDHPSIVKLLAFFESDEHYFLILERELSGHVMPLWSGAY